MVAPRAGIGVPEGVGRRIADSVQTTDHGAVFAKHTRPVVGA